jgi:hypothetical protein
MSFIKNNKTIVIILVVIMLVILVYLTNKSEHYSKSMDNVCGGFCTCPSCRANNSIFDNNFTCRNNTEHFPSDNYSVESKVNTLQQEIDVMRRQMNKDTLAIDKLEREIKSHDNQNVDLDTQKSHMDRIKGHSDNIHHVTSGCVAGNYECESDEIAVPSSKLHHLMPTTHAMPAMDMFSMPTTHTMPTMPTTHTMPIMQTTHAMPTSVQHSYPQMLNEMYPFHQLLNKTPESLQKCTPALFKSAMTIMEMIGKTNGDLNNLKKIEPNLTTEMHNFNNLLSKLNKTNISCFEKETGQQLNLCTPLEKMNTYELKKQVDNVGYLNELLKSQKNNLKDLHKLFITRLKDLVGQCDKSNPDKRKLQLELIQNVHEILNTMAYIFQ